jgi:phage-related tail fiber protein
MSLTTNKGIDIITIGSPNWGQPVNDNSTLIDKAFGSFTTVSGTSGDITLTTTQYQNMCLKSDTAAFLANVTFVIPSGVAGQWVVINQSAANNFELRIKNAADAAFVSIPRGETRTVYSDGTKVFLSDTGSVPSGSVMMFAMSTAPTGWLKANGAAVSRTTYAALFAAIGTTFGAGDGATTFNVPELRGEFLRGWDDGRAVDTGRVFGSAQLDQMQRITGEGGADVWGRRSGTPVSTGAITMVTGPNQLFAGTGSSATFSRLQFDSADSPSARASSTTSGETRSRNVALLACIKF